jgi:ribosomal-protein-alanine N-acetyltransferase
VSASAEPGIRTPRLQLRRWRETDRDAFAALNADSRVREFFSGTLTRAESDAAADRNAAHFDEHGYGWWAVEIPGIIEFAGCVGLSRPRFEAHFTPCVEIGWRLAATYWGRGYATEAAHAAVDYGFEILALDEIVSFTVPANQRSRRVMKKLGMSHDPADDFDHPLLPEGDPLRRHVLYRLSRDAWQQR